ncbi:thiamine pyrophosphate protein domain protein TPP-binding protein [Thermobaculum terrenum ATCC BAA-798]|uniref:Thiamine pyrophosphate protein domain protein TPP-binding protein n=1 Tax=Thermobaculum terrenum (strain ATCC BAA-798 / CCMEE 7001 / YNP1) TaxID=525904 RepID=D1CH03_THET1|nr:thiamine pyrophosphate-dependent enzyme [Thermobaculum terrenum]ACZ43024.1 thiamine pyrophosphate protein domain protein TPP-binding protein [Thermobaculum terrenum ATCC BAA-798]
MADTTADILVDRLVQWGVQVVFGLPGDGINGLMEALRKRQDDIKFVQVRHEESAAFAACGYAKFTGRLGVCLATSGPGGIHLLNGLYDAKLDGAPVLAITGHTFHDLIGTHYQQDVDLDKVFQDVAAYNERVMGPTHAINVLDEAVKTALAQHTVAHITVPKDIQDWEADDAHRSTANIPEHSAELFAAARALPSEAELREAAEVINGGSKVAIFAGRGSVGARQELLELAEKVGGVIIKPLLGKTSVPDDSPYTTGGIGLLGTAPSVDAVRECDTLLLVGTSFPYMEFYPKPGQARAVQIDIDPARIGLRYPVEVGLVGDSSEILRRLLPMVQPKEDKSFLRKAQKGMEDWRRLMKERGTRADKPMKPEVVTHHLNKYLADDAIVISDTGTVTTWVARHIDARGSMQFSASGMLATMANGLPYAIGAATAFPHRQVVAIVGDGGFTMLMGDLATVAKYSLPVKVVIIKNNTLGQIKWEQIVLEGNPEYGNDLHPIDFELYARAVGVPAYTLEDPGDADELLRRAMAEPGPCLVQAVVDSSEPPMPGNITLEQAVHFARSMLRGEKDRAEIIKTIIKDKVREVI